jgi:hypothetical protein
MKLTKSQLNQIVQEELKSLMEVDADIAAALMGKAGLPQSAQDTKVDRPIVPQDLGDEDEPASERAEEDEVIESAREMYMQGALMLPDEYHEKYKNEKLHQQVFAKEFLPKFIEKPHMDPYHARAIIISGLEDISGTMDDVFIDSESNPLEENRMRLTKTKLQQIIKEELENLINSESLEDNTDALAARVKDDVEELSVEYGGVMQSVGETLPRWLQTDEPLNSIMKKYPYLKKLKPVELKNALGIESIGPNGEPI